MKNNSSFVAEPHVRFESEFDPKNLVLKREIYIVD